MKTDILDILRSHIRPTLHLSKPMYDKQLDETITHVQKALYYKDGASLAYLLTSPDIYLRTLAEEIIKNGDR